MGVLDRQMASPALESLFGSQLLTKEGPRSTSEVLAGKTNIAIYFSAHWCPPCRGFTPLLAEKFKATDKSIAIVFVSADRDEEAFNQYYGEMPWLAVPFVDERVKERLNEKFGVRGIPCLVILDGAGELVTKDGRGQVDQYFG